MTSRSLWDYYKDEIDVADNNHSEGKSLKYIKKKVG